MHEVVFESIGTVSREEFVAFVHDRARQGDVHAYELLNGRIVMTPPAGFPHGSIELSVALVVKVFVDTRGLGRVFGASQGFELPSGDTVSPDLSFVSARRWDAGPVAEPGKFLRVVPDLVVEILSGATATHDRGEKKAIYERNGVGEYWLVDPRGRQVTQLVRSAERFGAGTVFSEGDAFDCEIIPGLRIEVAAIFRE